MTEQQKRFKEMIEVQLEATGFEQIEVAFKKFFSVPWIYIKAYHNKKAVIYDISEGSFKQYGACLDSVKKEWCRAWGEW